MVYGKFFSNDRVVQLIKGFQESKQDGNVCDYLIQCVLAYRAEQLNMPLKSLFNQKDKRQFHDDITVIVVFFSNQ